jgi:hypothetical protein
MISVQLDQAGHHQITAGVLARRRRVALAKFRNAAIRKSDPAALDDAVRQNDPGVGKYGFGLG